MLSSAPCKDQPGCAEIHLTFTLPCACRGLHTRGHCVWKPEERDMCIAPSTCCCSGRAGRFSIARSCLEKVQLGFSPCLGPAGTPLSGSLAPGLSMPLSSHHTLLRNLPQNLPSPVCSPSLALPCSPGVVPLPEAALSLGKATSQAVGRRGPELPPRSAFQVCLLLCPAPRALGGLSDPACSLAPQPPPRSVPCSQQLPRLLDCLP